MKTWEKSKSNTVKLGTSHREETLGVLRHR